MVTEPDSTVTFASSEGLFVKYKKGMPIPVVAWKLWEAFVQSIVTVQSEKSDTFAELADKPVTPIVTGSMSSITPQGIYVATSPLFFVLRVNG